MKKGSGIILASFVAVLVFVILFSGLASADWLDSVQGALNPIINSISGLGEIAIAQFLLFFLLALIIYTISDSFFFTKKNTIISVLIAIIVSLLGIYFLPNNSEQWIYSILASYNAMAVAITTIIPVLIIAVFSRRLYQNRKPSIISKVLWVIFLTVLIARFVSASSAEIGTVQRVIFWVVASVAALMLIWERRVWFMMFRQEIRNAGETARAESLAQVTSDLERIREQILNAQNGAVGRPLIQKFNRLAAHQRSLGGNYQDWQNNNMWP